MLKKLAKYGNSTALVIDKAIMEILEIEELSIVKLHTDGKSLIITPVRANQEMTKISYGADEAMQVSLRVLQEDAKKHFNEISAESRLLFQKESRILMDKYQDEFKKFLQVSVTPEFREEVVKISQKYDPVSQSQQYIEEFNKLKYQFCSELEKMDQEMAAISQKYFFTK